MAKQKPFFSIIIPTLNEEKYLPHLLSDLSTQTFRDFEVIIVDGHSNDQTVKLARSWAPKLPKLTILTSPKRHVCVQRNLGAQHSIGNVLIFSDADNRFPPSFLLGLRYRWETSRAEIIVCRFEPDIKTPQNDAISLAINTFLEIQSNVKPKYLLECMFSIQKNPFNKIGGFDESVNYAEGKSLVESAIKLGFTIKTVKDPIYTFSFRRLRKYGALKIASHIATLELASLFGNNDYKANELYPMDGGTLFNPDKKVKTKFQKNIAKLLVYLKSSD